MELYLDRDGRTLHLEWCKFAETKRRWLWADPKTPGMVYAAMTRHGYEFCETCPGERVGFQ